MEIQSAKAIYSRLIADEQFERQLKQAASHEECFRALKIGGFACTSDNLDIAKNQSLSSDLRSPNLFYFPHFLTKIGS